MTRCWRGGVELAGVGVFQPADIARELDAGRLHAEADAEVRHLLFARVADGVEHAFDAALAEAAGDEDAVEAFKLRFVARDRRGSSIPGPRLRSR